MTRAGTETQRARLPRAVEYTALCLTAGLATLLFWGFGQRSTYAELLPLAVPNATRDETVLVHWTACAETVLFLLPGLLLASALIVLRKGPLARALFLVCSSASLLYLSLDLVAYRVAGRHLQELARFAWLPGAARATGVHPGDWLAMILPRCALITASLVALLWCARIGLGWLTTRSSRGFQQLLACLGSLLLLLAMLTPYWARTMIQHRALSAGMRAQLTWVPPAALTAQLEDNAGDRTWAALEQDFRSAYTRAFPLVFSRRPFTVSGSASNPRANALVIVLESLRPDAFTAERMPRLYAWSRLGLVARQHYSGSNYSEASIFALLYGRSPLLYHFALDTHEPATWCRVAHAFGGLCAWYSGQPLIWVRQEEFVNEKSIDRFEHDERGDWNQWDRAALERAVAATRSNDQPVISVVYLMSTHFEYRYPQKYEQHRPVLASADWPKTSELDLTSGDRTPLTNRYLNALSFSDDLIADAIDRVDATRSLIVLTGDHGEALGEGGRFGHGFAFPDQVARVPFVMVGPGIPARTLEAPSLHADVLRTVAHWLGGRSSGVDYSRDLLAPASTRQSLLLSHGSFSQDSADALFIHGARRIRLKLGLKDATLKMLGPENELAQPVELTPISAAEAAQLRAAFDAELEMLWRNQSDAPR